MKDKEKEVVREFLIDYIICYKPCMATYTEDRWIKIFCDKRLETFLATDMDFIEEKTKVNLHNQKNLAEFKKIYRDMFIDEMHDYISKLKKIKDEEEREQYKAKSVKRKPQEDENSKKKKRK